jgi:serine/threonine-protein kinase HipA
MNGAFVGTWSIAPHAGETLQYDPQWINSAQGRPLSLSLPFIPGNLPHRGEKVRSYFENLLPDSREIRERVARRYRADTTEAFDLLAEIGRDCVGALQILPGGALPEGTQRVDATPLTEAQVAQVLRGTMAPAPLGLGDTQDEFRISLAGAQEKTALLYLDDEWCTPHGATPTTHIFKLPLGLVGGLKFDLGDSVENEWLCALILRAYGLPVADCAPLRFEEMKVLSVRRFDRAWWTAADGARTLLRLPQEDMCQANGLSPLLKYEADGGPGVDSIMKLLNNSIERDTDRRTFFQAQVVFWLLCATDGHAKNFSLFLRPGGRYQLTPLYDVLSAYPILGEGLGKLSPFKAKMAMVVRAKNPHWKMREILRRHWLDVGERHGVTAADGRGAHGVVDDLVARTPQVIQTVRAQLPPDFPPAVADSIFAGLQEAAHRLAG